MGCVNQNIFAKGKQNRRTPNRPMGHRPKERKACPGPTEKVLHFAKVETSAISLGERFHATAQVYLGRAGHLCD
jgi:hypothetical protein